MIIINLFAIYINLLHFSSSQYVNIWSENMESKTPEGWSGFGNHDFGYSSSNCPNGDSDKCAVVRANTNDDGELEKTTDISLYSALRLVFDVNVHGIEAQEGDKCTVYYQYDNQNWQLQWKHSTDGTYHTETTNFPKPLLNNTQITIWLEVVGDATGDTDKCYWDNVVLKGIRYTSAPTKFPTQSPSTNPSLTPTLKPTLTPTLNPSLNPTLYPSLNPTLHPISPTLNPSLTPTVIPSLNPTFNPSSPSTNPTMNPSLNPTLNPTLYPTFNPSVNPSTYPSMNPSLNPTLNPTISPSLNPSESPTPDGVKVDDVTTTNIIKEKPRNAGESGGISNTILLVMIVIIVVLFCIVCLLFLILKQKRNANKENLEKMKSVSSLSGQDICTPNFTTDTNMEHNIASSTSVIKTTKVATYETPGNIEMKTPNEEDNEDSLYGGATYKTAGNIEMKNGNEKDSEDSLYDEGNDVEMVTKSTPFDDKTPFEDKNRGNDNDLLKEDNENIDDYDGIYTQGSHQTTTGNVDENDND